MAMLPPELQAKLHLMTQLSALLNSSLERQAALGALAQGVAHEVRNPVMIIGGFAHLLQKQLPPDDHVREALDQIPAASQRLEVMVKEIESFCAMPEPRFRATDPGAV